MYYAFSAYNKNTFLIHKQIVPSTENSFKNTSFIIGIILFLLLGIITGFVARKNGLIEGLLSSLIIICLSLIINLILKVNITSFYFIKIASFTLSSMAGGIIGVNLANRKK